MMQLDVELAMKINEHQTNERMEGFVSSTNHFMKKCVPIFGDFDVAST